MFLCVNNCQKLCYFSLCFIILFYISPKSEFKRFFFLKKIFFHMESKHKAKDKRVNLKHPGWPLSISVFGDKCTISPSSHAHICCTLGSSYPSPSDPCPSGADSDFPHQLMFPVFFLNTLYYFQSICSFAVFLT